MLRSMWAALLYDYLALSSWLESCGIEISPMESVIDSDWAIDSDSGDTPL